MSEALLISLTIISFILFLFVLALFFAILKLYTEILKDNAQWARKGGDKEKEKVNHTA